MIMTNEDNYSLIKVTLYGGKDNKSSLYIRCSEENTTFLWRLRAEFNKLTGPDIWISPCFNDMKVNGTIADLRDNSNHY